MALINLIGLLLLLLYHELLFNKSWDKVQRQTTELQYGSNCLKGNGNLRGKSLCAKKKKFICKKSVNNAIFTVVSWYSNCVCCFCYWQQSQFLLPFLLLFWTKCWSNSQKHKLLTQQQNNWKTERRMDRQRDGKEFAKPSHKALPAAKI